MSMSDELEKLQRLHQSGALSADEFAKAKADLLNSSAGPSSVAPGNLERDTHQWSMLLHLSQLLNCLLPSAGYVVPIVLWQVKKSELPGIDEHGKNVANWVISSLIYWVAAVALCFTIILIVVAIPMFIVLGVLSIVFPIIGAVKANNGEVWPYPLSIKFFK
jgi:uncharacterized protein